MFTENYRVEFTSFSQRHFLKSFEKKYRTNWQVTRRALVQQLGRIDTMVESSRAEIIKREDVYWLVKFNFAIAGMKQSPRGSGNRVIAYVDHHNRLVRVLIIYSKNDISEPNETAKWQSLVKEHFSEEWMKVHATF